MYIIILYVLDGIDGKRLIINSFHYIEQGHWLVNLVINLMYTYCFSRYSVNMYLIFFSYFLHFSDFSEELKRSLPEFKENISKLTQDGAEDSEPSSRSQRSEQVSRSIQGHNNL